MSNVTVNEPYKLMRARKGRMLGGVAAGLAESSGLDVTVVRICIGATVLTFGLGVPAYILMWVVLPEESPKRGRVIEPAPEGTARTIRVSILALAALSVLNRLGGFWPSNPSGDGFGWGGVLGLILLGVGVTVLFSRHRPDRSWWEPTRPPSTGGNPSTRTPAPAGDDYYYDEVHDEEDAPTFVGPLRDVMGPVSDAVSSAFREARTTMTESRPTRPPQPPRPRRPAGAYVDDYYYDDDELDALDLDEVERPTAVATVTAHGLNSSGGAALGWARVIGWFALIWWTLSAIAVTAGWAFGALAIEAPWLLGIASWLVFTAVLNVLLHAKFARAIVPALALLLIPVAIGAATIRPVGNIGHRISEPRTVPQETKSYRQAVGRLDLNFGRTEFEEASTTINGRVGVGAIFVEVPDDAEVVVNARAGLGGYKIFGQESDRMRARERLTSPGCEGGPKLELNLRTGIGYIEINRDNGKRTATCRAA